MALLLVIGVALTALWLTAVYVTYKEHQMAKYAVQIHPGSVFGGASSTVSAPIVVAPIQHNVIPMVSGDAVRHYAHSGHATMPASSNSNYALYTTSSATVHSIGGGSSYNPSSFNHYSVAHGIRPGSGAATIPTLAWAQTSFSASTMYEAAGVMARMRRVAPGTGGTNGEWQETDPNEWWYYDEDQWISPWIGATRPAGNGDYWVWNGSAWVLVSNQGDPGLPVGDTPWLLLILLVAGYGVLQARKNDSSQFAK